MNTENRTSEQKWKKVARYVGVNSIFAALAYFGFYDGIDQIATAFNIIVIGLDGMLFLIAGMVIGLRNNHDFKTRMAETNGPEVGSVPRYVDIVYDMAMIVFLAKFAPILALGVYCLMVFLQTFLLDFIQKRILNRTPIFGNMDTEDEDRDELIRLGVLGNEARR